jgi:hypothetical protein
MITLTIDSFMSTIRECPNRAACDIHKQLVPRAIDLREALGASGRYRAAVPITSVALEKAESRLKASVLLARLVSNDPVHALTCSVTTIIAASRPAIDVNCSSKGNTGIVYHAGLRREHLTLVQ